MPAPHTGGVPSPVPGAAPDRWRSRSRRAANTVGNAPMLAVNRALGYRRVAGILFLRRPA